MVYHIFKILSAFYYNTNFIAADPISNLTFIKIAERHKNTYLCTRSVMTEIPFNILFIKLYHKSWLMCKVTCSWYRKQVSLQYIIIYWSTFPFLNVDFDVAFLCKLSTNYLTKSAPLCTVTLVVSQWIDKDRSFWYIVFQPNVVIGFVCKNVDLKIKQDIKLVYTLM